MIYAAARFALVFACGSMVLTNLLVFVFALAERENENDWKKSTALKARMASDTRRVRGHYERFIQGLRFCNPRDPCWPGARLGHWRSDCADLSDLNLCAGIGRCA